MAYHKHDMEGTSVYRAWISLRARCNNPSDKDYEHYGGRGIKVCDRWLTSFESFYADMGDKPTASHSLDRINVNGDYEPSNCRWATKRQQRVNRRTANPTGVMGVFLTKRKTKPYSAMIVIEGKYTYLGTFDTIDEAKLVRKKAEETHWNDSYT